MATHYNFENRSAPIYLDAACTHAYWQDKVLNMALLLQVTL
jgi:hypothetical protein